MGLYNNLQCLVFVGSMDNHVADRIEAYAAENDMKVIDTIFKDDKALGKLFFYIEKEAISAILVKSIWDIDSDKKKIKELLTVAADHNISINEEQRSFAPALIGYDA